MYFAKNIGKNISNKYCQKLLDRAKMSRTDTIKIASKRAIQKTAEATEDLIGNKIADNCFKSDYKCFNKISKGVKFKRIFIK